MKILKKIWGISLLALLLIIAAPRTTKAQDEAISEQDFYDALAPYGTWVYDNTYGDVWLPDVDEDFRPYQTQGYWVMTEYGNTWVSDYPWGWATFHYGRWRFDDYYGWEWIPGYEWAPAWVSWRSGNGYYGWAPLSPDVDFSVSAGSGNYDDYWAFAPAAYMYSTSIYSYYVPRTRVTNIIHRTNVINNNWTYNGHSYIGGPHASDIAQYTHRRPTVYGITNASRPGNISVGAKDVSIYRPNISRLPNARPQRVVDGKAYQQQNPNERIARGGSSLTFNRNNAQHLANEARNTNNNNLIRVNGQPNQPPAQAPGHNIPVAPNAPLLQGTTTPPARGNANTTPPQQQQKNVNPTQQNNNNGQRQPYHGRPETRPDITPPRRQDNSKGQQQRDAQQQAAQQQARARGQAHQQQNIRQQQSDQQAKQQNAQRQQQEAQQSQQQEQQRQAQQRQQQEAQQRQQQEQQRQAQQRQQQEAQQRQQQEQQRQAQQRQQQEAQQRQQQEQQRQVQQQQQRQQQQQHRRPPGRQ